VDEDKVYRFLLNAFKLAHVIHKNEDVPHNANSSCKDKECTFENTQKHFSIGRKMNPAITFLMKTISNVFMHV
jgi:hypothetical protein